MAVTSMSLGRYLNTEKTWAIFPMARILFRITSLRAAAASPIQKKACELKAIFNGNKITFTRMKEKSGRLREG